MLSAGREGVSLCFARWMLLPPKMLRYETKEMTRFGDTLPRCAAPFRRGAAMESSKLMDAVQFALNSEAPEHRSPTLCATPNCFQEMLDSQALGGKERE